MNEFRFLTTRQAAGAVQELLHDLKVETGRREGDQVDAWDYYANTILACLREYDNVLGNFEEDVRRACPQTA